MAIKNYKPVTPSMRGLKTIDRSDLHKGSPMKILSSGLVKSSAGRNNTGRITVRHRSVGHKKLYRFIDFKRDKFDIEAAVERIEYDPNRTAFIALIKYTDNVYSYIISPSKLNVGDKIKSSKKNVLDVNPGNAMPLKLIPIGTIIHNIELKSGKGGAVSRSAGSYSQLVGKDNGYALIKMQSGEIRMFLLDCMATIGAVSNSDNKNTSIGKAGRKRWLGIRPTVRGVAMNPVDHPHGGGEGRTSGGRHPVSPTGVLAKGKKTRSKKKSNRLIVKTRKKN
jgi:large subunit ribosomal protein L2|tara:strand:- start:208 stop:1044 length:837 start_codon:yes stop_codon:yes gene_type:complete